MKLLTLFGLLLIGYVAADELIQSSDATVIARLQKQYPWGRITGGSSTAITSYPFIVSLQFHLASGLVWHSCGGSLISASIILSAAHCQPSASDRATYHARAGSAQHASGGQTRWISGFVPHPQYISNTLDNDVAILRVQSAFSLGSAVAVVRLPAVNQDPAVGAIVNVAGWGRTNENINVAASTLQHVGLPVWDQTRCRSVYWFLTARQICLGGLPQGGQSACMGDSGGPGVINGVQFGIVSGGNSCTAPNVPGIYVRVGTVRAWIQSTAGV